MILFQNITKHFPGVAALQDVTFEVRTAECHALLGENGAGKSTLGKILAGMYRPDGGRVLIDGREARFHSPREAARAGVGIVHQELAFCPNLSVAENLCLHDLPRRGLLLDRPRLRSRAEGLLAQVGLSVDVGRPLSSLSIAQEQLVQIAAAVGLGAKILVFDEPTSSLGQAEVERLFQLIRGLQKSGTTIVYVSHRLEEIFELCQTVTVLRDGRHVATQPIGDLAHDDLVRMMVGRSIAVARSTGFQARSSPTNGTIAPDAGQLHLSASSKSTHGPGSPCYGAVRLQCRRFSSPGRFADVQLDVRSGEIVGLAGLVGAGRTEVLEALFGLDREARGETLVDGRPVVVRSPRDAQALRMALIPEDRKRQGLVMSMNVRENLTLSILDRFRRRFGIADRRAERTVADRFRERLAIR
ncbi:MAG: sugar ABC transporter ATP-binding protein, partial [Deltaproteobacteria bacterium]